MNSASSFGHGSPVLMISGVSKHFTLHHQHGALLPVFDRVDLEVWPGECVVLDGPSGMGKSTLLKLVYANYRASAGNIHVRQSNGRLIDLTVAEPRELVAVRRHAVGYVSQFLRVIPRVSTLDVVAEPLAEEAGLDPALLEDARDQARRWLTRLNIPESMWSLPPATFSGGEQQRVNIARTLIKPRPLLLLDEPTASLDETNTRTVIELIIDERSRGAAVLGIFHDRQVADAVATRHVSVSTFRHGNPVLGDRPTSLYPNLQGVPA